METEVYQSGEKGKTSPPADLKVRVRDRCLVYPAEETERKNMYLSNIDQVLNFDVQTVHFFEAKDEFPGEIVAEKVKKGLSKVLVHYDYLAGRLKTNEVVGRMEIDCNAAGFGFIVASSDYSLDDLGDLVYPNPAFRQLILLNLDVQDHHHDHPLCILQVTTFKCGGFAIGLSTNHITFDGLSFKLFLENLASQTADKPILIPPLNDRTLLAARSPPRVTFPHPELLKLKLPIGQEDQPLPTVFDSQDHGLDFRIFRLTSDHLSCLKEKAKAGPNQSKVTGFNVVTALLWRCKALSSTPDDKDRMSTVLYAVDIRPRLNPPLPKSYTGNAVLTAYATAPCKVLEEGPFSRLVEMVSEGAARMTDDYARSAIDWGEVYKGFPHGEFLVSSWWRLGFDQVEYPWGKPRYSCPVVYHRKDIILLFPDINNGDNQKSNSRSGSDGVNILVALPTKEMDLFQTFFHRFLA